MKGSSLLSPRRLAALCRKEAFQILRDPSSVLIAFVIPVLLLVIFGYGINFDAKDLRVGIVLEEQSAEARRFADVFAASPFLAVTVSDHREPLIRAMQAGKLRGIVVIPENFSRLLEKGESFAPVQVITDGSEPNTANFVQGYVTGVWRTWIAQQAEDAGRPEAGRQLVEAEVRYWFNPDAVSRNFIIPGAVTIIITVVGAVLTSLVVAREWERGTMEALLATRITRAELLLSKLIPYYMLGLFALIVCMIFSIFILQVPFRGSWPILLLLSSLFLLNTLGMGLLISTVTRNQFDAAQIALNAAFLPAIMLSGFVFEISSMPAVVRAFTYLIPARYYVSIMQTLFLTGNVPWLLTINALFLTATALLFLGLTAIKTPTRLV